MWEEVSYPDFTMNALANRLGLAKGTLYLYFPTKEELFLTFYERLLQAWFDELVAVLATTGAWSPERVAQIIAVSLERHGALVRLVPLLEGILEHNISPEKARSYKTWLLGEVTRVGEKLERALPYLAAGDGVRVLIYVQALISGLGPMGRPAPVIAQLMADFDLSVLQVDFIPTFERGLAALLRGLKPKLSRTAHMG